MNKITHAFFDFDGCFTDNMVYVDQDGKESVRCCRADGIGMEMLRQNGIVAWIISSDSNPICYHRAEKMNVQCRFNVKDKLVVIQEICADLSKAVFMGNDVNDIEAMEAVGYPIMPIDAEKRPCVSMSLNMLPKDTRQQNGGVTYSKGGEGAVREVCEWIIKHNEEAT